MKTAECVVETVYLNGVLHVDKGNLPGAHRNPYGQTWCAPSDSNIVLCLSEGPTGAFERVKIEQYVASPSAPCPPTEGVIFQSLSQNRPEVRSIIKRWFLNLWDFE